LTKFPEHDLIVSSEEERIVFIIDLFEHNNQFKCTTVSIGNMYELSRHRSFRKASFIKFFPPTGNPVVVKIVDGKFTELREGNAANRSEIQFYKMMRFEIVLVEDVVPFYDSMKVTLTSPGKIQFTFLENHLKNLRDIYERYSSCFYAPLCGFIQSSGFGKTKLCLDLIQKHPGIYCVFRKEGESGVPVMASWMVLFTIFIKGAKKDDLPLRDEIDKSIANDSTPGRFLIGLMILLQSYNKTLEEKLGKNPSEEKKIKTLAEIGASFDRDSDSVLTFNFQKDQEYTFLQVKNQITTSLNTIEGHVGRKDYPFVVLLDELDVLCFSKSKGRAGGLNIARRGLHCLEINTKIFVLAIGTNSDALDYTPALRDNSLRYEKREYILPPFILSGNWDIFSGNLKYGDIILNRWSLTNCVMFNILVSFGRPLWSSCKLLDCMKMAEAKLRNGFSDSIGALLALLLVRANLTVNIHHVLSRSLLKSYMIIVNYVSSDANDMKIGYSSEPVLAMASRTLLREKATRIRALLALKEFLSQRAIDKGRIVEALFEYLILFSIDDANMNISTMHDSPDAPQFPENIRIQLTKCEVFLLECRKANFENARPKTNPDRESSLMNFRKSNYRIITFESQLLSMLGERFSVDLGRIIKPATLNAFIGTTHFLQLEKARESDFTGISNFNASVDMARDRNVIDKALLKMGVLRQCGFTMPPNHFGIDFILPMVIKRPVDDEKKDDLFSFVAVQSKSSKQSLVECAFKMSAVFHINRCPNKDHLKEFDCIENKCKAYMSLVDIKTILNDQVVILLSASGSSNRTTNITVSLKGRKLPEKDKTNESKNVTSNPAGTSTVKEQKTEAELIVEDSFKNFKSEMLEFVTSDSEREKIRAVSYPTYFNGVDSQLHPDIIITKNFEGLVTIQKMKWMCSDDDEELEALLLKKLSKGTKCTEDLTEATSQLIINKGAKSLNTGIIRSLMQAQEQAQTTATPGTKRIKLGPLISRSLTCIAIHDIGLFEHLIGGKNGITLMREIFEFSLSNFQNIDPLHKPIIQNSVLNGTCSPYYELNPMLREIRGQSSSVPLNPLDNYSNRFTYANLETSIKSCITGPVDKILPGIAENYYLDAEAEMAKNTFEFEFENKQGQSESDPDQSEPEIDQVDQ
jgi:hypothetical protein